MGDFSFVKLDWYKKPRKTQVWIIVMDFQHSPRLRHLFGNTRMVMRLREIGITQMILLQGWYCIWHQTHQYVWFTHNTKESHDMAVNRILWYLQGTKDKVLVHNPLKKPVTEFYVDEVFAGLWEHESSKEPIWLGVGLDLW